MDILLFDSKTAVESIAFAMQMSDKAPEGTGWDECFNLFVNKMVPLIRAVARKAEPT